MQDVYDELERLYDRANGKSGSVGEGIFLSAGFFVDYERLLDRGIQNTIRKYLYSKASNTPPYASIQETPATFIEDFIVIDEETKDITHSIQSGNIAKGNK